VVAVHEAAGVAQIIYGRSGDQIVGVRSALASLLIDAHLDDDDLVQVQEVIDCLDFAVRRLDDVQRGIEPSWVRVLRGMRLPTLMTFTDAELRVVALVPTQLSAKEMARRLYVSTNTIKSHLKSIYMKLGATSRGEAITALYTMFGTAERKTA